jgi:sulfonate transport system permease protein
MNEFEAASISVVELETPKPMIAKNRNRAWSLFTRATVPILVLITWQLLSSSQLFPPLTFPTPLETIQELQAMWTRESLLLNILVSLTRSIVGLALGVVIGFTLGIFSGLSKIGEELVDAPLQALRAVPFIALIPLFIIWFGIGEVPKILLISFATFYAMYINTSNGVRNVDKKVVESAKSFGVTGNELTRKVIFPLALPQILTGFRLSMIVSVLALVGAEQIAASRGIGFLMIQAQSYSRSYEVFACVIIYAFFGVMADLIVRVIERRALKWRVGVAVR